MNDFRLASTRRTDPGTQPVAASSSPKVLVSEGVLAWLHIKSWLLGMLIVAVGPGLLRPYASPPVAQFIPLLLSQVLLQRQAPDEASFGLTRNIAFNGSAVFAGTALRFLLAL